MLKGAVMQNLEDVRNPERETIPAWYRLSLKNSSTLVVSIHKKAVNHLRGIDYVKAPMVQGITETFRFEDFIPPTESPWGFGRRTLFGSEAPLELTHSQNDQWESCECVLPVFHEDTDHHMFMAVRASLSVLFKVLEIYGFDGNTGSDRSQLIIIQGLHLDLNLHGGSFGAAVTPTLIQYLHKQPDNKQLVEVVKAMSRASHHMLGKPKDYDDSYYYRALCRQPKWINLTVPGDACGLDPSDYCDKSLNRGYNLCPHNVDSTFQQLSLLMGLAKLHQLAEDSS